MCIRDSDMPVQTSTWNYYNYNSKMNNYDSSRPSYYNNRGTSETSYTGSGYRDHYRRFPTSISEMPHSTAGMMYNRNPWGIPNGYNPYYRNNDQHPEPSSTPYHAFSQTPVTYYNQHMATPGYMNRGSWDYTTHNKNWNSQVSGGRIFVTEASNTNQFRNSNPNRRIPVALPPIQLPPSYIPPRLGQSVSTASPIFIGTRKPVPSPSASAHSGTPAIREGIIYSYNCKEKPTSLEFCTQTLSTGLSGICTVLTSYVLFFIFHKYILQFLKTYSIAHCDSKDYMFCFCQLSK